jgi:hypothetical protein
VGSEELEEEEEENTAFDEQDEDIPEVTLEEMEESFLDAENNLDASREGTSRAREGRVRVGEKNRLAC